MIGVVLRPLREIVRLKLTNKFLLFGLIPAAAQIVICGQLFWLLSSAEHYAEVEARQRNISKNLALCMAQCFDVAIALASFAAMPIPDTYSRLQDSSHEMDKVLKELRQESRDDPEMIAGIDRLMAAGVASKNNYLAEKRGIKWRPQSDDPTFDNVNIEEYKVGHDFMKRLKDMNVLFDRQNRKLEELKKKESDSRHGVVFLVCVELALSIIVIAVCYGLFHYDFMRRFNNLLQMASDLALDRVPSTDVHGGDELGQLSHALMRAAEARQEAVNEKQMLYQMVTHDLRSPLMATSIVVTTLLNDLEGAPDKRKNRLQAMERSLQRVVTLTNDLLTLEKLSAGGLEIERTVQDFKETVEKAFEAVRPLAEHKNCLLTNGAPSEAVYLDEPRIIQVLVNLLANAIKFAPPGSAVEVVSRPEGNRLRVEVMDRGPGISEKDIQKLFRPFKQGNDDQKASGFGLGLTIAKMLVDLHEGNIGARVRSGGGTIFWFTLKV